MKKNSKRLSNLDTLCKILSPTVNREAVLHKIKSKQPNWLTIVEITNENFLTAALYIKLKEKDLLRHIDDRELTAYLEEIYQINLERNLEIIEQSKELSQTLEKIGLRPLFLKGAASLLLKDYQDPGMRFLTDIDFYIEQDNIQKTLSSLRSIGYVRDPKCAYDYDALHHHYTPMFSPKWQTFIEPHIAILYHNRTILLPNKNSYRESPFDRGIYTFNPTDRFLHAYLHADFDHKRYWRRELDLRQLYEMTILATKYSDQIQWDSIRRFVEQLHISNPFNDQMKFIETLFGISIPVTKSTLRSKLYSISIQSKFIYKTNPVAAKYEEKIYSKLKSLYKRLKSLFFKKR